MTELELPSPAEHVVLDLASVEDYIRDSKLALLNAFAFLVLVGTYTGVRVVLDVPYVRAAVGLYLAVAISSMVVKLRLGSGPRARLGSLLVATGAGLLAQLAVLLGLVQLNRGTVFAEAAGALVGLTVTHLLDRVAFARA